MDNTLIILGSGYTARFLWPLVSDRLPAVYATSRSPEQHLSYVPPAQRLRFDLADTETWTNIPRDADVIWCFPAEPLDHVRRFTASLGRSPRQLVVLGSTSAYNRAAETSEYPPPWIDESSPIDCSLPRVQGEEWLRTEQGAIILRIAGIYGPDRNPLDWIAQGRVGASRKYVNLIHVEDLAHICLHALASGKPGEIYNVSDGIPRTWNDICRVAEERWHIKPVQNANRPDAGKRISNAKLIQKLGYTIHHSDLYGELQHP
ncbi:MAG: hypothetical protein U0412_07095 [Nitrospira sp.]